MRLGAVQAEPLETECVHCAREGVSGNTEQEHFKGKERTSGHARLPKSLGGKKVEEEEVSSLPNAKNAHALTGVLIFLK